MSGHNRIKVGRSVGLLCAGVTVLASFPAASAASSASTRWRVVARTRTMFPAGIVAQSRHSAWALGSGFAAAQPQSTFPAGLHWNGHSWRRVSFPKAISTTGIGCAGQSSGTDVWAFAGTTTSGGFASTAGALRLEGGRWRLVKKLVPAGIVTGCLVEDPTEVWVFGDAHVAPGVGTWHLHGRRWAQVPSGDYALDGASAVSPDDVWAFGETGFLHPVVAHWNGRAWVRNTRLTKVLPKSATIVPPATGAIAATGRNDVWFRFYVSKNVNGHSRISPEVLHWNGREWRKVGPTAFGYYLPGAVPDGHGGWWVDVLGPGLRGRVLHDVRGHWRLVPVSIAGCPTGTPVQLAPVPRSESVLGLEACSVRPRPAVNVLLYGPRL